MGRSGPGSRRAAPLAAAGLALGALLAACGTDAGAPRREGPPGPGAAARGAGDLPSGGLWIEPVTGAELVRIPGGTFLMGSTGGAEDEHPEHEVRLPAFYIGRFELTRAQWVRVTGEDPSHFEPCPECPVEQVSWRDIEGFLARIRERGGLPLRLPSEAEWEFAAAGGDRRQTWPGTDDPEELPDYAWFKGRFEGRVHPVGRKKPNAFGLHDLAGNVAEWCLDWYDAGYYSRAPAESPGGPEAGARRVVRGGSFLASADSLRTSRRAATDPDARRRSIGFRMAMDSAGGGQRP